jgi:hypothetical protein
MKYILWIVWQKGDFVSVQVFVWQLECTKGGLCLCPSICVTVGVYVTWTNEWAMSKKRKLEQKTKLAKPSNPPNIASNKPIIYCKGRQDEKWSFPESVPSSIPSSVQSIHPKRTNIYFHSSVRHPSWHPSVHPSDRHPGSSEVAGCTPSLYWV